jgi:hypothetical protein
MDNIAQFVALIKQKRGVAKKNRFRIKIYLSRELAPLSESGDGGRDMSLLCESISFPSKTITSIDFSSYRNPIKIPTGFANEDVTAVFHLTNDYYIKKIFDLWLNSIVNTEDYFIAYDAKFKTSVEIFQLDEKDQMIYGVELKDAYPISMSAVELDNSQTNATQKLTVNFTYNTWVPVGKDRLDDINPYIGDINFTPDNPATNTNLPDAVLS